MMFSSPKLPGLIGLVLSRLSRAGDRRKFLSVRVSYSSFVRKLRPGAGTIADGDEATKIKAAAAHLVAHAMIASDSEEYRPQCEEPDAWRDSPEERPA